MYIPPDFQVEQTLFEIVAFPFSVAQSHRLLISVDPEKETLLVWLLLCRKHDRMSERRWKFSAQFKVEVAY